MSSEITLNVKGMHCASCANTIEAELNKQSGVQKAHVNFASEKLYLDYDSTLISLEAIKKSVKQLGYGLSESVSDDDVILKQSHFNLILCWSLTLPVMLLMLLEMIFGIAWPTPIIYQLVILLLASIVLLFPGRATLLSAFKSVQQHSANMDVLIALGTLAAYFSGWISFFLPVANYSAIAAMIMAFHLTGRYIEHRAKGRASAAIKKLLTLSAKTARVLVNGQEKEVPVDAVQVGDIMLVKPGEKIPTDGVIIKGESAIDESIATGESMPVHKKRDDEVIGATINQEGLLQIKATKVGEATFLSQIIKMVEKAQGTKVPIQRFADQVTAIFVPIVLVIALLTFIVWFLMPGVGHHVLLWGSQYLPWINPNLGPVSSSLLATVSVLVIACPCALGLATPTALMVGSGLGATHGILIRKGEAIQLMKEVKAIVFDKTGTLTIGQPKVTNLFALNGSDEAELLQLAATVEAGSEHPLAKAIVEYAKERHVSLGETSDFKAIAGKGVEAKVNGHFIKVGSLKLLSEEKISEQATSLFNQFKKEAKTAVWVSRDEKLIGVIAIADVIKQEAKAAIELLHQQKIKTVMLTGDNQQTANTIAKQLGIDDVIAEVLPEEKANVIIELQKKIGRIAMVGDGINDAPALTQADVGIAIGTGTDIAIESADITIVSGDLMALISAIHLSRETFKTIKQNLFWAFGYNIIAIPIAMLGLLHPVIAEIAMAVSSISVVTNANLLKIKKTFF